MTRRGGRIVVGALNPRSLWGAWHRRELQSEPWRTARFLAGRDLVRLGAAHGTVLLAEGLHAPGRLPGLERWGPAAAERLARRLRVPGGFPGADDRAKMSLVRQVSCQFGVYMERRYRPLRRRPAGKHRRTPWSSARTTLANATDRRGGVDLAKVVARSIGRQAVRGSR